MYRRRFRMLQHTFELRTTVPNLGEVFERWYSSFRAPAGEPVAVSFEIRGNVETDEDPRPYEILRDGTSTGRVSSIGLLLDLVIRDTTEAALTGTTRFAAIHAAAATRRGRAVLLPAPAGNGKTTTAAALVRHGWGFLTDEAALVSLEDQLVHPFPRPLSVSPRTMTVLPGVMESMPAVYERFRHLEYHLAPDDLRPGCCSRPALTRAIVFPSYTDTSITMITPIPRADALLTLLTLCFNLRAIDREGLRTLARVVAGADCYRLSIGAVDEAVQLLERLVAEPVAAAR